MSDAEESENLEQETGGVSDSSSASSKSRVEGADELTIADDSEAASVGPEGTHKLGRPIGGANESDLSGRQLGDYRLVRKIAKGGMGEVYEGVQLALDRRVAVKIISDDLVTDPTFVQRFEREAKSSAALNHPNVAQVYDFGREGDRLYLVMEYVDGLDLAAYIKQHDKVSLTEGMAIVRQVVSALQFALGLSIIHRDIKPANLLYATDGTVKITDLGLAKKLTEDSDVTLTGTGIGSPHYLAPEQADDARTVDHRADIYALGITLLFLLTARRPFEGDSAFSVVLAHANKPLPSGEDLGTPLPDEVEQLIHRMAAKCPTDRYADYDELLADIDRIENGLAPLQSPTSGPETEGSSASRGIAYLVTAVVAAVAVIIVLQSGGDDEAGVGEPANGAKALVAPAAAPIAADSASAPESTESYPPRGSAEATRMLEERIDAIIRHFLPRPKVIEANPMPDGDLAEMIATAEKFAAENPEAYQQILARYNQLEEKARGTSEAPAVAAARGAWVRKFHEADEKAFQEALEKVDAALMNQQPHRAFTAWEEFPKNLLSQTIIDQAVAAIRRLPGPFMGHFIADQMPGMSIPEELKIPDELVPEEGITAYLRPQGGQVGRPRGGAGQRPERPNGQGGRLGPPGARGGSGGLRGPKGRPPQLNQ